MREKSASYLDSIVTEETETAVLEARRGLERGGPSRELENLTIVRCVTPLWVDVALEVARQTELGLKADTATTLTQMETLISNAMSSAEEVANVSVINQQRYQSEQRELMEAWREDGMTTLSTTVLDSLVVEGTDISRYSANVSTALALLAGYGHQMVQATNAEALSTLRQNAIEPQFTQMRDWLDRRLTMHLIQKEAR